MQEFRNWLFGGILIAALLVYLAWPWLFQPLAQGTVALNDTAFAGAVIAGIVSWPLWVLGYRRLADTTVGTFTAIEQRKRDPALWKLKGLFATTVGALFVFAIVYLFESGVARVLPGPTTAATATVTTAAHYRRRSNCGLELAMSLSDGRDVDVCIESILSSKVVPEYADCAAVGDVLPVHVRKTPLGDVAVLDSAPPCRAR